MIETRLSKPVGSLDGMGLPEGSNIRNENWSGVAPASTLVVKFKTNESFVPAVKNAANVFVKALSVSDAPEVKSPLAPPLVFAASTAPALPPMLNEKLLNAAVLLASPRPLPSVNTKIISACGLDARLEVFTDTFTDTPSAQALLGRRAKNRAGTKIGIHNRFFLFMVVSIIVDRFLPGLGSYRKLLLLWDR